MGKNTEIAWCDHTFNPWIGCQKVSAGCQNCYAEKLANFHGWVNEWGKDYKLTSDSNWKKPIKWAKQAVKDGVVRRVFCASLADVFDENVYEHWRANLWGLIEETERIGGLEWLLLTKRPENITEDFMLRFVPHLRNIRIGITVENQEMAEKRLPIFVNNWGGKNFISVEPMLGPINLSGYLGVKNETKKSRVNSLSGGFNGGIRNRQGRENLEGFVQEGQGVGTGNKNDTLQTEKSGTFGGEVFSGKGDDQQEESACISASPHLVSFSRRNPGEYDDQSQKREHSGQQNREFGNVDNVGADSSLLSRFGKPPEKELGGSICWVICGCESGTSARPCNIEWIRDLRDQCVASGTPFFLKQMSVDGKLVKEPFLDGRQWLEFPKN
jgi:protein gp37